MRNTRLDETQLESRLQGKLSTSAMQMTPHFGRKSEEELKSLSMKVKEESEKAGLKLNMQNTKIMASSPLTSWQIDGETIGNSDRLSFLGLQNHCRWWLQSWNWKMLAPWKKSYDQPRQHIKKQRHYFTDKGPSSLSYGFSSSHVWMWELDCEESWAPMMLLNCVREDSWLSLGQQGDQTRQS